MWTWGGQGRWGVSAHRWEVRPALPQYPRLRRGPQWRPRRMSYRTVVHGSPAACHRRLRPQRPRGSKRQPVRSSAQHESWNEAQDGRGAVPEPPRLLGRCRTWAALRSLEMKPSLALPTRLPAPSSEELSRRGSRSTSRRCCSPRLMPWAGTRFPQSSDGSCLMRPWRWWGMRVRRWGDRSRPSGEPARAAPRGWRDWRRRPAVGREMPWRGTPAPQAQYWGRRRDVHRRECGRARIG